MTWISVNDRLPTPEDGDYLLVVHEINLLLGGTKPDIDIAFYQDGGWLDARDCMSLNVTHWQRLPELPS